MPEQTNFPPNEPDETNDETFSVDDFALEDDSRSDASALTDDSNNSDEASESGLRDIQDLTLAEFFGAWMKSPTKLGDGFLGYIKTE
ncbi:MAG: hypothetical protein Q9P01_15605 [Anaerolineae bacterium]|nr:hypothetical protein [Anaerolineae bacterium]